jgi:protein TonB
LVSYVVVEARFKVITYEEPSSYPGEGFTYAVVNQYEIEKEQETKPETKREQPKDLVRFEIGDPKEELTEKIIIEALPQGDPNDVFDASVVPEFYDDGPVLEIPISVVEIKPIFPGCENAINKAQCMQEKIDKIINRKFNTEVAEDYNLKGKQTIYVSFKIDQHGFVTQIAPLVRGKNASKMSPNAKNALELEAKRAVAALPKFIPGIQDKKPVIVPYVVPITFVVTE